MKKIAVVTTFSEAGWRQYAERMVTSFDKNWPEKVDLYCYPDARVEPPKTTDRVRFLYPTLPLRDAFLATYGKDPKYRGLGGERYNYRFDPVKFVHKPLVLHHFATTFNLQQDRPYDAMIWLDADTLTHKAIPARVVDRQMCPPDASVLYLGRVDKYSECGFLSFNLNEAVARECIMGWAGMFYMGLFEREKEWHDSYLFDVVRKDIESGYEFPEQHGFRSLTSFPRRKGGGHPFINSFLGEYMDHLKGDTRKALGKHRPGDLYVTHASEYWRK